MIQYIDENETAYNFGVIETDKLLEIGTIGKNGRTWEECQVAIQARFDAEPMQASKSRKLNEFQAWASAQSEVVHEFQIGSKTIKLKANDKTKSNLQDLKGTLDDMIALGIFNAETHTFDAFYNEGETAPHSITYQELLQIRVHIAGILQNLYIKMKTVPAQINAIELADYDTLDDATAALDAVTWE